MTKFGQRVVATLLSALLFISVLPIEPAKADSKKLMDGFVFWGTSGISRLYGDLYGSLFGDGEQRKGKHDAEQHEWATYHSTEQSFQDTITSPLGGDYGYLNLGQFRYYTVADAPSYAVLSNDHDGWSRYNTSDLRVSKNQSWLRPDRDGGDDSLVGSLRNTIEAGILGKNTHKSDPQDWQIDKTAVVFWAGEDWVVRNADSSDIGLPSGVGNAKHLQWYWMGLDIEPRGTKYKYYDHYFDPAPGANKIDKHGDVLHVYVDGGVSEVARQVPLSSIWGSHYGSGGEAVTECEHDNQQNCNRLNDVDHVYSSGDPGSANASYHHSLVFYNSYMIRDVMLSDWKEDGNPGPKDEPHMDLDSGFQYNYDEDAITRAPDHILTEITDKLPGYSSSDPVKLPTQVGLCFGRVLSGYGYSVEYLEQDVSQNKDGSYSGASTSVMTDENGAIVYQTEKDPETGETLYEPELGDNGTPLYLTKKGNYYEEGSLPADEEFELDDYGRKIQKDKQDPFAASRPPVNKYILVDGQRIPVYTRDHSDPGYDKDDPSTWETTNPDEAATVTQKKQATDAAGKPKYSAGKPVYLTPTGEETTDPEAAAEETVLARATEQETRIPVYKLDAEGKKIPEEGVSVDRNRTQKVWCCIYHEPVYVPVTSSSWSENDKFSRATWDPDLYDEDEQDHNYDTGVPSRRYARNGYYWDENTERFNGQKVNTAERIGRGPEKIDVAVAGPDTLYYTWIRERYLGKKTIVDTTDYDKYKPICDDPFYYSSARNRYYWNDETQEFEATTDSYTGYYYFKKITAADVRANIGATSVTLTNWQFYLVPKPGYSGTPYYAGKGVYRHGRYELRVPYNYKVQYAFIGSVTTTVVVDEYCREVAYEEYHPAWYEWHQIEVPLHERCDYDLAPDTGYADSWHTHKYGGIGGFVDGFPVFPEVDDDGEVDGRVNKIPTEKEDHRIEVGENAGGTFEEYLDQHKGEPQVDLDYGVWHEEHIDDLIDEGMDRPTLGGKGSEADHGDDFTEIQTWFTNPDKPIMKSQSEARAVRGYIDYLKDWFGKEAWNNYYSEKQGTLKFYVFGLGAYNKAYYEDQRDEIWTDGETAPESNNTDTVSVSVRHSESDSDFFTDGWGSPIDEIKRTDRIEEARKLFGKSLRSNLRGGTYIDLYDITADSRPYFRYQSLWSSAYRHDDSHMINAQHGKWYDQNTNTYVFNIMWNTILKDNPADPWGDPISASFYSASSALTTYANGIVSVRGRNLADKSGKSSGESSEGESGGTEIKDLHKLSELSDNDTLGELKFNAGIAGSAMGYGDESYDFKEAYVAHDSASSSVIDYVGILGLEDQSGTLTNKSGMYLYSQYGKLLEDLGIDEVDEEHPVSPRTMPGLVLSGAYVSNSALHLLWSTTIDLLRMLNPFGILAQSTQIAESAEAAKFTGSTVDAGANTWLVDMARRSPAIKKMFGALGQIYDIFAGHGSSSEVDLTDPFSGEVKTQTVNFSVVILYLALFIGGTLLFYSQYKKKKQLWSRTKILIIRIVFILIGIPIIANMYTAVLDGLSQEISVVGSPSSQMVSATIVDFGGWVRASRLAPPEGSKLEILIEKSADNGHATADSISSLRKTAWAINQTTGAFDNVQMTHFNSEALTDPVIWNNFAYVKYDPSVPAVVDGWKKSTATVGEVWSVLKGWMNDSYYYSTTFESDSLAAFAADHPEMLGHIAEAGTESSTTEDDGSTTEFGANTLYELFNESTVEKWDARTLEENTDILSGTKWQDFSIYTNGGLQAKISGDPLSHTSGGKTSIKYTKGAGNDSDVVDAPARYRKGLDITKNNGGLSSLSMYNYLSSDFSEGSVIVYSSAKAPSGYTSKAHHRVNLIGSGALEILFFLNCFVFIFAAVIIGFAYSFKMCLSVLKRGFQTIVAIPGAMLGLMKSIAQVIVSVLGMILEIFVSITMYAAICDILMVLNTVLEGPLTTMLEHLAGYGAISELMPMTIASYVLHLAVMTIGLGVFSICAYMFAPAFLRVWDKLVVVSFMLITGRAPVEKPVRERQAYRPRPAGTSLGVTICDLFL